MKKEQAKKILANVLPEKAFWVSNGPVLKNISELTEGLKNMSPQTFLHHVNQQKNDFANWIKDAIGDSILAEQISKMKTKAAIQKAVTTRVEALQKALK